MGIERMVFWRVSTKKTNGVTGVFEDSKILRLLMIIHYI